MQLCRSLQLIVLLYAGIAAPVVAQTSDPIVSPSDLAEMEHCRLTLDSWKRMYAAQADLAMVAKSDARLVQKLNGELTSIEFRTRMLQSEPVFVTALMRNGFTAHGYTVVEFTVVQTAVALMAKLEGATPAVLAKVHVAPGNIELMEQHEAEINAFRAKSKQR